MSLSGTLAKRLSDYRAKNSIGSRFRRKRMEPLLSMIDETFERHDRVTIVDIGGTETYWTIVPQNLLDEKNIEITIVNIPGSGVTITRPRFYYVEADGCDLSLYDDCAFHIAHSNSVVQLVGDWQRMVRFAGEVSRVAEKYFVQTPNYWFPIEPSLMFPAYHWLPRPIRLSLALRFDMGHWRRAQDVDAGMRLVEHATLLDRRMFQALFSDAIIHTERVMLLPKSFIATRA